ncbi:T9SS type A sorting domain-containing protein [Chryseobacterium jejuense]
MPDAKTFILYPNPVTDLLHIKSKENVNKVEIYDISGRKMSADLNDNQVNVKNLNPGSYIINIETKKGKTTEKFIKK